MKRLPINAKWIFSGIIVLMIPAVFLAIKYNSQQKTNVVQGMKLIVGGIASVGTDDPRSEPNERPAHNRPIAEVAKRPVPSIQ
jgi:hypothetical protein